MRKLLASVVVAAFFAAGSPAVAQLGEGVKKVGNATVEGTKKGVEATEKGAKKVGNATKDAVTTTYVCRDGKTDTVTVKANACKDHGGIKAEKAKPKK